MWRCLGGSAVKRLPLAQGMILGVLGLSPLGGSLLLLWVSYELKKKKKEQNVDGGCQGLGQGDMGSDYQQVLGFSEAVERLSH